MLAVAVLILQTLRLSLPYEDFVKLFQTYSSSVTFACVPTPIMDIVVGELLLLFFLIFVSHCHGQWAVNTLRLGR